MTSINFCYWLQGFIEVANPKELNEQQVDLIKRHLSMVFKHEIDPAMGGKEHQDALSHLHDPGNYGENYVVRC